MNGQPDLDLSGLEDKWRDDSPDHPPCALCGKQIGSEEEDEREDETTEPTTPVRVWRKRADGRTQEMAFHIECARPLMKGTRA